MPAKAWAVLLQLQLLTPRLTDDGVVVVSRLLADEEDGFGFFLALGHGESALRNEGPPKIGSDLIIYRATNYAELNPFSASLEGPVPPDRFWCRAGGGSGLPTRHPRQGPFYQQDRAVSGRMSILAATDQRAAEIDLEAINPLQVAVDFSGLEVDPFRDFRPIHVRDRTKSPLGEDIDHHRQG